MKKICVFFLVLCCWVSFFTVGVQATDAADTVDRTIANGCNTLDAGNPFLGKAKLTDNTTGAILYETQSQTLMYAQDADVRTDPASLVKIMTGMLVAEKGTMTDAVTVTEDAISSIPKSAATSKLLAGEVLTVEQLMHCMLVSSANDAAAVLAHYVAGSQDAFVTMMNDRADELGCTETNFVNVHGLYDYEQYSSARDLAKILDAALKNEDFRRVFCTTNYTVPATNMSEVRYLSTGNYLMSYDDVIVYYDTRVKGGRTGVTDSGYRNLATLAQSGNMELICIFLGAASELDENGYSIKVFGGYNETSDLLSKGFNGMRLTMVTRENQVLDQQKVANGDCDVVLGPSTAVYAVLPSNLNLDDLRFQYSEELVLQAPIEKGDAIGFVDIWYENICVAQTELFAMNSVDVVEEQVEQTQQVQQEDDRSVIWITLVIAGAVVLLVLVFRGISRSARRRYNNRSRNYRRDHRRSR